MTASETKIAVIQKEQELMALDINELKSDVKEIKGFLMGEDPKVVTKKEFEVYKASQNFGKLIIGVVTSVITALITFEVLRQIGK